EAGMATYVGLIDWTEQGVANFKDSVDRYEAARDGFEKLGVTFKDIYWTLGGHDLVAILDAPDEESLAAALLMLSSQGNLRTTTLRAFSADEMRTVIAKT
ncbi:MAG: GYD domain-containing protein, partial [Actinomycetota bacterium]|nr:GYD domain-containing protein [Actinomycetota bacterium]